MRKEAVIKKNVKIKSGVVNYIAIVIDESTSMSSLRHKVVQKFNETLKQIKQKSKVNLGQKTYVSLFTFADTPKQVFINAPIEDLKDITVEDYEPNGWTALLDGTGHAIEVLERNIHPVGSNYSNLVIVITDGNENRSWKYSSIGLRNKILTLQATDCWTFVFQVPAGKKQSTANDFKIPIDNIQEWENTIDGTEQAFASTSVGLGNYFTARSKGLRSVSNFYTTDLSNVSKQDLKTNLTDVSQDFRVLNVDKECAIQDFVERQTGKAYLKGMSFYELTKPEKVQHNKEILIGEKNKKTLWGGQEARNLLGLPEWQDAKVVPGNHSDYNIFVQSTSVNRKLVRGTKVLVRK